MNLFLTGVTGVLGSRILKDLLTKTDLHIYCLVRAQSVDDARARALSFLKIYDDSASIEAEFSKRVSIIVGDVSQTNFELDQDAYDTLARTIDLVFHAAASTHLFLTYPRIEPVNVSGVKHVIDFTLKTEKKRLHYVSTFTVVGNKLYDPSVIFTEEHHDIGQEFLCMGYQQSKFVAEQLIHRAEAQGLVWNIYRPGQIFGETETGAYPHGKTNVSGLFLDIFKTVIETGVAFQSDGKFDITPVDYVSQAILFFMLKRDRAFETYHVINPNRLSYSEIIDLIRQEGYPIRDVEQSVYSQMLVEDTLNYQSPTTLAFKTWLTHAKFDFRATAHICCEFTVSLLQKEKITCAPITRKLLRTYLQRGIKTGYFPKPTESTYLNHEHLL
jgi:thioester reductase-like protein